MQNKQDKIKFIHTLACESVAIETIFGLNVMVSYALRMYYGPTKVRARIKQHDDLVEIKAYGLLVVRNLQFDQRIPSHVAQKLKYQGYKVIEEFNMAVLNKDFGFMTAQNYEINHLMHAVHRSEEHVFQDFNTLCHIIVKEASTWGEPVIDVTGRLVYDEELKEVKRNPFAKAGRLALKKKLNAQRFRTIKDALTGNSNNNNGKGVDM